MNEASVRILVISVNIDTTLYNFTKWLDYYYFTFTKNYGIGEINDQLDVYFKESKGGNNNLRKYFFIGRPSSKREFFHPDDERAYCYEDTILPSETILGVLNATKQNEENINVKCWQVKNEHEDIFNQFFHDLLLGFLPDQPKTKMIDSEIQDPELLPWLCIKDHGWDRSALQMWWEGANIHAIATRFKVAIRTASNRISELRRIYGKEIVPYSTDRKSKY